MPHRYINIATRCTYTHIYIYINVYIRGNDRLCNDVTCRVGRRIGILIVGAGRGGRDTSKG